MGIGLSNYFFERLNKINQHKINHHKIPQKLKYK